MNIYKNAISFFQKMYPHASIMQEEINLTSAIDNRNTFTFLAIIVIDSFAGIKLRGFVSNGRVNEEVISNLAKQAGNIFLNIDNRLHIEYDYPLSAKQAKISKSDMPFSKRIIFYTHGAHNMPEDIVNLFDKENLCLGVYTEDKMYHSVFISYGDPDNKVATEINNYICSKGVKTWLFSKDHMYAVGTKLHRMMYDGINNYDKCLLICSESSLTRNGVLNEIEEVFTKEASNGGSQILIPISIDDYIFDDRKWSTDKINIAKRIRTRVIARIDSQNLGSEETLKVLDALVISLLKKG